MNFAEAIERLEIWVSLTHANFIEGIDKLAREMMAFAAGELRMQCPASLPAQFRLDTEMEPYGQYVPDIKVVVLKQWDGSPQHQGVLAHEIAHYVQAFNDLPFCEEQAYRVQRAWLQREAV